MKKQFALITALMIMTLLFASGCSALTQATATQAPTVDINAVRTEVAQTVAAQITLNAAQTLAAEPTATVQIDTPTSAPTATAPSATSEPAVAEASATPTVRIVYPTFTPTYYPDRGQVSAISPEIGKDFKPGADFDLKITLKNVGDLDWTTGYRLKYLSGVQASTHGGGTYEVVYLPSAVDTGKTVEISIDMIAPSQPGHYTSNWALVNTDNTTFLTISYAFDVVN